MVAIAHERWPLAISSKYSFWYFGKLAAYETWSRAKVRLYVNTFRYTVTSRDKYIFFDKHDGSFNFRTIVTRKLFYKRLFAAYSGMTDFLGV